MFFGKRYKAIAFFLCITLAVMNFSGVSLVSAAEARTGSSNYYSNQGELEEGAFIELPLGAVTPEGWLKDQLNLQKDGITGAMEDYDNYGANSGWLGGTGENWEKGPYYVRGLVALAYTLNEESLKQKAQKWIDWSINSQRADGFFGPSNNTDWWPRMPMLMAIRDYYEATENLGTPDERVIPFLEKYFRYQLTALPSSPLQSWAIARGGDNLEVVIWLYNRLYDQSNPEASEWLMELADILISQTTDWTGQFNNTTVREHVVNTGQALKTPALRYLISGSDTDKYAFETGLLNISIDHGRIDGLPNADESPADNKPTRGTELCGIVESMWSTELAIAAIGDVTYADRLEKIAYNSLPAAYAPDYLGASYFISQNQVLATAGNHEFSTDHGDDLTFGAPCGYECCFPNNHMGWPKYVQSMWMATNDDGLAVIAYGPNKVTAKVADGKNAVFTQDTTYPFDEAIVLNYSGESAVFPLELKIPSWCENPVVKVNEVVQTGVVTGEFFRIEREFVAGDKIEITFPMTIETSTWYSGAVAVERGPLVYSLKIGQEWIENTDPEIRQMSVTARGGLMHREVYPTTPWNYGLIIDENDIEGSFEVVKSAVGEQPFDTDSAPVTLKAKGQLIPEWQLDGNLVGDISFGKIEYNEEMTADIELIPFGCARLRITQFPQIGENTSVLRYSDVSVRTRGDQRIQEISNVAVPEAGEYIMNVSYTGAGTLSFVLNGKVIGEREFSGTSSSIGISGLKGMIADSYFMFNENHVNNIRFIGNDGVEITGISIRMVDRLDSVTVNSVSAVEGGFSVTTNIDREASQYYIRYGTSSGNYTVTASGFHGNTATVTGLSAGTYYFVVEANIGGNKTVSAESSVTVSGAEEDSGPSYSVVAPETPVFDDYSDASASESMWTKIGATSKINFRNGKMVFGEDSNVKAILNGGESWNDYVVEAKIQLTQFKEFNNAGIMFRVTEPASGPDAYKGYYFGITQSKAMVGYSNNGWFPIKDIECGLSYGNEYTLKVIASGDKMAFYINGELIYWWSDSRYSTGTAGLRSYEESFTADDYTVRALTDEDKANIEDAFNGVEMEVTGRRYSGTAQVRYPNISTATSYKVMFGTEPGVYTNEVYDHYYNSFTGGAAGVTAVSLPDDGETYYVKMAALNGSSEVGSSEEIVFQPFCFNAPAGLDTTPASSAEAADGIITGVSEAMEYRSENETDYIRCTGDVISGLAPGKYFVRVAATNDTRASEEIAVTVGAVSLIIGDMNNDKLVNVADVVKLRRLVMAGSWTSYEFEAGNLVADDTLNVSDVVALRQMIMNPAE